MTDTPTIDPDALYWSTSSSGHIEMQLPGDCLMAIAQSGDNEAAVRDWLDLDPVRSEINALDPDDIRSELREYGAWDDDELADDELNKMRFLWLAAHSAAEEIRSGEYRE